MHSFILATEEFVAKKELPATHSTYISAIRRISAAIAGSGTACAVAPLLARKASTPFKKRDAIEERDGGSSASISSSSAVCHCGGAVRA